MRLINADEHECWACKHHATGKCDTWCDASESFELREDVKNAKTAFDVEKVLNKLEVLYDLANPNQELAVLQAIDIVKKGGVK